MGRDKCPQSGQQTYDLMVQMSTPMLRNRSALEKVEVEVGTIIIEELVLVSYNQEEDDNVIDQILPLE